MKPQRSEMMIGAVVGVVARVGSVPEAEDRTRNVSQPAADRGIDAAAPALEVVPTRAGRDSLVHAGAFPGTDEGVRHEMVAGAGERGVIEAVALEPLALRRPG